MKTVLTLLVLCVICAGTASAQPYAYVTNYGSENVSVIDVSTNTYVATVPVGLGPSGVAVSPDGKFVYVANSGANNVSIIQTSDNTVINTSAGIVPPNEGSPQGIGVTDNTVFVAISCEPYTYACGVTACPSGTTSLGNCGGWLLPTGVGGTQLNSPKGLAVIPLSYTDIYNVTTWNNVVFTTNPDANNISLSYYPNQTDLPVGELISVGKTPVGIAVGQFNGSWYIVVANNGSDNVSICYAGVYSGTLPLPDNCFSKTVVVGKGPWGVAISPDGQFIYVTNSGANNVSVIDTSTLKVVATVVVGGDPSGIAVTPDGNYVYVANSDSNNVSVIDTSTNKEVAVVGVGAYPANIAITPDTDLDGVSNGNDADDDNDGIPDGMEKSAAQARSLDSPRDEIPGDNDGDGKPNERDLDSDGDGLPDHVEGGGDNDKNMDGIADNFLDADGDGHNDAHDPTQGGDVLALPDTDGDGLPDFLDTDSDNDGISDANETAGCVDADGDGKLDNSADANNDGLADIVHPETGEPCALLDTDGDGIFDHLDAEDNRGNGSSSCTIAPFRASDASLLVYLLIPAFILIARLWRRRTIQKRT